MSPYAYDDSILLMDSNQTEIVFLADERSDQSRLKDARFSLVYAFLQKR